MQRHIHSLRLRLSQRIDGTFIYYDCVRDNKTTVHSYITTVFETMKRRFFYWDRQCLRQWNDSTFTHFDCDWVSEATVHSFITTVLETMHPRWFRCVRLTALETVNRRYIHSLRLRLGQWIDGTFTEIGSVRDGETTVQSFITTVLETMKRQYMHPLRLRLS